MSRHSRRNIVGLLAVLAVFFQVLARSKFVGCLLVIAFLILRRSMPALGLRPRFAARPLMHRHHQSKRYYRHLHLCFQYRSLGFLLEYL